MQTSEGFCLKCLFLKLVSQTSLFSLLSVNIRLVAFKTASDSTKCCGKQIASLCFILGDSARSCGQNPALVDT